MSCGIATNHANNILNVTGGTSSPIPDTKVLLDNLKPSTNLKAQKIMRYSRNRNVVEYADANDVSVAAISCSPQQLKENGINLISGVRGSIGPLVETLISDCKVIQRDRFENGQSDMEVHECLVELAKHLSEKMQLHFYIQKNSELYIPEDTLYLDKKENVNHSIIVDFEETRLWLKERYQKKLNVKV